MRPPPPPTTTTTTNTTTSTTHNAVHVRVRPRHLEAVPDAQSKQQTSEGHNHRVIPKAALSVLDRTFFFTHEQIHKAGKENIPTKLITHSEEETQLLGTDRTKKKKGEKKSGCVGRCGGREGGGDFFLFHSVRLVSLLNGPLREDEG